MLLKQDLDRILMGRLKHKSHQSDEGSYLSHSTCIRLVPNIPGSLGHNLYKVDQYLMSSQGNQKYRFQLGKWLRTFHRKDTFRQFGYSI